MFPDTVCGAVVSAAFADGVSLVSILKAGDWTRIFTPARHSFPHKLLQQIKTKIQFYVLLQLSV